MSFTKIEHADGRFTIKLNNPDSFSGGEVIDVEGTNYSSEFISELVNIKDLDYFFTNSISRASKTMSECRQTKEKLRKTGT